MYLSKPTKLNRECLIAAVYEASGRELGLTKRRMAAHVQLTVLVRVGTLGQYFEVCEALVQKIRMPKDITDVVDPNLHGPQTVYGDLTEEQ